MIRFLLLLLLAGGPLACASDYYVDCNYGSNGNPGTSPQLAWRTLLQVGISSFLPGDTINLRRDCTWNETLTPPSSGSSMANIKIDSYGNGRPPHLTGYMPIDGAVVDSGGKHERLVRHALFGDERAVECGAVRDSGILLSDTGSVATEVCAVWHGVGCWAG